MSWAFIDLAKEGAFNLARNCAEARSGDKVTLVNERGRVEEDAVDLIVEAVTSQGASCDVLWVERGPDGLMLSKSEMDTVLNADKVIASTGDMAPFADLIHAEQIGLRPGDVVVTINSQPVDPGTDLADLLRSFPPGRPLLLTVLRGTESVRVTGRYAPTVLAGESGAMFPRQRESGRVDLVRTGNRIDAKSRGVAAFTLLLSPDQFDLDRAVMVVVNGRTAFDGIVQKDVKTLLEWAARDNDRTMLFAAELPITVSP